MPDEGLTVDGSAADKAAAAVAESIGRIQGEQRKANRQVADHVAGWLRSAASSGTPAQARFAGAFRPRATTSAARIAVLSSGRNGGANPTFFGMARRTGWNVANTDSKPQAPPPIGSNWSLGQPGQGPYVARDVLPRRLDDIGREYEAAYIDSLKPAFPEAS